MHTWVGENFDAAGHQVLGIERDPLDNHIRASAPVPINIHCKNCNYIWNPALRPMTLAASGELACKGQNVTCPECSNTGEIRLILR